MTSPVYIHIKDTKVASSLEQAQETAALLQAMVEQLALKFPVYLRRAPTVEKKIPFGAEAPFWIVQYRFTAGRSEDHPAGLLKSTETFGEVDVHGFGLQG